MSVTGRDIHRMVGMVGFGALLGANSQRRNETERNDGDKSQNLEVPHLFKLLK